MTNDPKSDIKDNNIKLEERLEKLGKIVQDFGLNFIQNIGELKHSISILIDKIDKVNNALVDLKGLKVQLDESYKFEVEINAKLNRIEALIKKSSFTNIDKSSDQKDSDKILKEQQSKEIIINFQNKIENIKNTEDLIKELEKIKEIIFEITGGHRVLTEIKSEINNLKSISELNENIKTKLKEKIKFWINKFEI